MQTQRSPGTETSAGGGGGAFCANTACCGAAARRETGSWETVCQQCMRHQPAIAGASTTRSPPTQPQAQHAKRGMRSTACTAHLHGRKVGGDGDVDRLALLHCRLRAAGHHAGRQAHNSRHAVEPMDRQEAKSAAAKRGPPCQAARQRQSLGDRSLLSPAGPGRPFAPSPPACPHAAAAPAAEEQPGAEFNPKQQCASSAWSSGASRRPLPATSA